MVSTDNALIPTFPLLPDLAISDTTLGSLIQPLPFTIPAPSVRFPGLRPIGHRVGPDPLLPRAGHLAHELREHKQQTSLTRSQTQVLRFSECGQLPATRWCISDDIGSYHFEGCRAR